MQRKEHNLTICRRLLVNAIKLADISHFACILMEIIQLQAKFYEFERHIPSLADFAFWAKTK